MIKMLYTIFIFSKDAYEMNKKRENDKKFKISSPGFLELFLQKGA